MSRKVADVMVKAEGALREDMTFQEVARALVDEDVSSLPVVDGGGRVPWLSGWTKRSIRDKLHATTAKMLMTSPAITVMPDTELTEAALRIRKHAVKRLPVCDAKHRLLGMLSRRDLLLEFVRPDEAIADDLAKLWRDMSLPMNDPRYAVTDGVATIEGRLKHRGKRRRPSVGCMRSPASPTWLTGSRGTTPMMSSRRAPSRGWASGCKEIDTMTRSAS